MADLVSIVLWFLALIVSLSIGVHSEKGSKRDVKILLVVLSIFVALAIALQVAA